MQTTRTLTSRKSSVSPPEPLTSRRLEVEDDPVALYERSLAEGWGDGLPVLPPTEQRVRDLLAATPYYPDDVICTLAPRNGVATVEKAAVNAAMAGCEPEAFPLVIAALEGISAPEFNLFGLVTTTTAGFCRSSTRIVSRTHHDVHDPQLPRPTTPQWMSRDHSLRSFRVVSPSSSIRAPVQITRATAPSRRSNFSHSSMTTM